MPYLWRGYAGRSWSAVYPGAPAGSRHSPSMATARLPLKSVGTPGEGRRGRRLRPVGGAVRVNAQLKVGGSSVSLGRHRARREGPLPAPPLTAHLARLITAVMGRNGDGAGAGCCRTATHAPTAAAAALRPPPHTPDSNKLMTRYRSYHTSNLPPLLSQFQRP